MQKIDVLDFEMYVREDNGISEELAIYGVHEKKATEVYRNLLKENSIVLEVGANLGYYAIIAARKNCTVISIEPDYDNYEVLCKNMEKYPGTTHNIAISNFEGLAPFTRMSFCNSGHIKRDYESQRYKDWVSNWYVDDITVLVTKLDTFIYNFPAPNVIRMDVEGHEVEVIEGGKEVLKLMPKGSLIFMEVHPIVRNPIDYNEMFHTLFDCGFSIINSQYQKVSKKNGTTIPEDVYDTNISSFHIFFGKSYTYKK